jgi:cell division protein FtsB
MRQYKISNEKMYLIDVHLSKSKKNYTILTSYLIIIMSQFQTLSWFEVQELSSSSVLTSVLSNGYVRAELSKRQSLQD